MKAVLITFGVITGIISSHQAFSNENKEVEINTSISMTYEQEQELLSEYLPSADLSFLNQAGDVQVYNSNYELISEGQFIEGEDVRNIELRNLLYNSDFIAAIRGKSIYILSK
jgi:hypothetical protein